MLPILIAAYALMRGTAGFIAWFKSLPEEEQEEVNTKAVAYAKQLFGKKLDKLTKSELSQVTKYIHESFYSCLGITSGQVLPFMLEFDSMMPHQDVRSWFLF